jgi:hypothetical protein
MFCTRIIMAGWSGGMIPVSGAEHPWFESDSEHPISFYILIFLMRDAALLLSLVRCKLCSNQKFAPMSPDCTDRIIMAGWSGGMIPASGSGGPKSNPWELLRE